MESTAYTDYGTAKALAEEAHADQYDRDGQLHIEHCIRVANSFRGERAAAAAVLHDALEDSPDFELEGRVDEHTYAVVRLLTRDEEDAYQVYVGKIAEAEGAVGEDARAIKLADLEDNIERCTKERGAASLLRRYLTARVTIYNAIHAAAA